MNKNFGKTLIVTFSIDEAEAGRLQAIGIELGAVIEAIGLRQDLTYTRNRPALIAYNGQPATKTKTKTKKKRASNTGSVEVIKAMFTANVEKVFTGMDIRAVLDAKGFDRNVSGSIINNLMSQKLIARLGRSQYRWVQAGNGDESSGDTPVPSAGPKSPTAHFTDFLSKFTKGETFALPTLSDYFLEKDIPTTKIGGALAQATKKQQIRKLSHGKYEVV